MSERMGEDEAVAQLRKTVAAGDRALLSPSYNAQVALLGIIDALRAELAAARTDRKTLAKAAHGAGYHNALTGVDPFESERQALEAAAKGV